MAVYDSKGNVYEDGIAHVMDHKQPSANDVVEQDFKALDRGVSPQKNAIDMARSWEDVRSIAGHEVIHDETQPVKPGDIVPESWTEEKDRVYAMDYKRQMRGVVDAVPRGEGGGGSTIQEKIAHAAVEMKDGRIYKGKTHFDIVKDMTDEQIGSGIRNDGFVTSSGRFVSREEAMNIMRFNDQERTPLYNPKRGYLTSEDVFKEAYDER